MFLVQYAVHLHGFFKEWRKNPQWSFSCCLALILPLLDMPGNTSGLAQTNVLATQLDAGHMEMSTFGGAVKDSGALDVTLEEDEQADDNSAELQKGNNAQIRAKETEMPMTDGAVEDSVAIGATTEYRDQGQVVKIQKGVCYGAGYNNKKCCQGTQTELSIKRHVAEVGDLQPAEESAL